MEALEPETTAANASHRAWLILDEASQVLVRAEALVLLLGSAHDVEEHHRYAAEIACDHLRALKGKLVDAQDLVRAPAWPGMRGRPPRRPGAA